MFSLAKYAYLACDREERAWYDNDVYAPPIKFSVCCNRLLRHRVGKTALPKFVCEEAARSGHIDCLRAVRRFGRRMDKWALNAALLGGHAECVDFVLNDGFKPEGTALTYSEAVRGGHKECLVTLRRHGVPWDGRELKFAIVEKRADCLRYLLQNGCTAQTKDIVRAAGHTDVTCLKILRDFGMEWDSWMLLIAHCKGNYDLMLYAVENGCPNPENRPLRRSERLSRGRRPYWILLK